MGRIWAIMQKELIHLRRDSRTLKLVIFMPLVQLTIYGFGINTDVKHLATAVYDEDRSALSRRLLDAFVQSAYFDITRQVDNPRDFRQAIDRGTVKAGIHIPPNFSQEALAGRTAQVQMAIDGSDSTPATTALNTGQAIVADFLQREGLVQAASPAIEYRPRLWYNPDLKSSFFMIPGLVGLLIQLLIPMVTASAVVREKESGNIEQLLVTPVRPTEVMIGKMLPYVGVGLIITTTILSAAHFVFGVPIRGNVVTLYVLTLLFLTVCLGIGLFASTIASTQQQASQIVMFFAAPSILLSGFIFPRETMPWPIHALGNIIPLTYFVKIIRGIVLKGLGIADLWPQILPLVAMAAGILFLSVRNFQKRLS